MAMSLVLIHTDRFAEHQTPPGHPERSERAEVMDVVADRWRSRGAEVVAPPPATREQLLRVHDGDYLRRVSEAQYAQSFAAATSSARATRRPRTTGSWSPTRGARA